jgi:hypothetical protein
VLNPLQAFPNQAAAKAFFRNASPPAVVLPAVVPYITLQLQYLELLHDQDGGDLPHDPIKVNDRIIGQKTPALYPFTGDTRCTEPWKLQGPQTPYLPPDGYPPRPNDRADLPHDPIKVNDCIVGRKTPVLYPFTGDTRCTETDVSSMTPVTKSLSNDLLSVFKKAVTEHTSSSHQRNARSLLQDNINGVNGSNLITQGRGFEMFHMRIKLGFSRGLGTEAISNLTEYVNAVQQNQESIGAFFDCMNQLYSQVQLTKGCHIGETAQRSFTLKGLRRGTYHEALGP